MCNFAPAIKQQIFLPLSHSLHHKGILTLLHD